MCLGEMGAKVPQSLFTSMELVGHTMEYIMSGMADKEHKELENNVDLMEVERVLKKNHSVMLTKDDLRDVLAKDEDGGISVIDPRAITKAGKFEDHCRVDIFLRSGVNENGKNLVYLMNGAFTVKYLVDLDDKRSPPTGTGPRGNALPTRLTSARIALFQRISLLLWVRTIKVRSGQGSISISRY